MTDIWLELYPHALEEIAHLRRNEVPVCSEVRNGRLEPLPVASSDAT